eukprot:6199995-Pleurochrysis_carterae.AAC.4
MTCAHFNLSLLFAYFAVVRAHICARASGKHACREKILTLGCIVAEIDMPVAVHLVVDQPLGAKLRHVQPGNAQRVQIPSARSGHRT